ncbi:hypothetical protein [Brevibacillus sp. IT-7CA2]|uniref:hypothetical protein n=1 Tax=Brevibacillus sp. IT-7CA2 TaxID=3026436 RepID=UPI0039E1F36B
MLPTVSTIIGRFGSWSIALLKANITNSKSSSPKKKTNLIYPFTAEDCIHALKLAASEIGPIFTIDKYMNWNEKHGKKYPTKAVIENRLGSWTSAKRAAGLFAYRGFNKEECLRSLREAKSMCTLEVLTEQAYEEYRSGIESIPDVLKIQFILECRWSNAKKMAGIQEQEVDKLFSIEDCLNAVNEVAEHYSGQLETDKSRHRQLT